MLTILRSKGTPKFHIRKAIQVIFTVIFNSVFISVEKSACSTSRSISHTSEWPACLKRWESWHKLNN